MRLHQITEDDLAELERTLPELAEALMPTMEGPAAPRLRVKLRRCQAILSSVRWGYGPPENVERVDP